LLITLLLVDQRRRWQQGDRVLVEAYLQQQPVLQHAPEALLDLICGEMVLREEIGEPLRLDDYLHRFPQLADELCVQFDIHRAIQSGTFTQDKGPAVPAAAIPLAVPVAECWTAPGLLDQLRGWRILEPAQVASLGRDLPADLSDGRAMARELLRRGWLTAGAARGPARHAITERGQGELTAFDPSPVLLFSCQSAGRQMRYRS